MASSNKKKLLEIIQNGRQFLTALEQFAATANLFVDCNDDDDGDGKATTAARLNDILQKEKDDDDDNHDAERFIDADEGRVEKIRTLPSPTENHKTSNPHRTEEVDTPIEEAMDPAYATTLTITGGIAQYCAKTGIILGHYPSLSVAAESLAESAATPTGTAPTKLVSYKTAISDVLSGRRKKAPMYKGFYFRYIGDTITPMPTFPIERGRKYHYSYTATSVAAVTPTTTTPTTTTLVPVGVGGDSKGRKKRKRDDYSDDTVPILQFCAKTGKQLGRFENISAAAKALAATTLSSSSTPDGIAIKTSKKRFQTAIRKIINTNNGDRRKKRPSFRGFYFRNANDVTSPFPDFPIPETGDESATTDDASVPKGNKRRRTRDVSYYHPSRLLLRKKKQRKNIGFHRPVLQFCAKTGKQLGRFDSQIHAATEIAKTTTTTPGTATTARELLRTGISKALNGYSKNGVYSGCYYRFADDTDSPMPTFPIAAKSSYNASLLSTTTTTITTTTTTDRQEEETEKRSATDVTGGVPETRAGSAAASRLAQEEGEEAKEATDHQPRLKKKKSLLGCYRPILQFCATTGKQLGRFDSQTHAAIEIAKTSTTTPGTATTAIGLLRTGISKALNRYVKNGVYAGSYYRYADDDDTDNPMPTFPIAAKSSYNAALFAKTTSTATSRKRQNQQGCDSSDDDDDAVQATLVTAGREKQPQQQQEQQQEQRKDDQSPKQSTSRKRQNQQGCDSNDDDAVQATLAATVTEKQQEQEQRKDDQSPKQSKSSSSSNNNNAVPGTTVTVDNIPPPSKQRDNDTSSEEETAATI